MNEYDSGPGSDECPAQETVFPSPGMRRGVRVRSERCLWGLPLYDIACGPDLERGEIRGHARGIIAIGDIATGVVALGGFARGVVALGGVAVGGFCFGGCALGLFLAFGGLAIGGCALGGVAVGLIALGGAAVGIVAVGGGAIGVYALGGGALGQHVLDGAHRDPEALRFFSEWIPGLRDWLK